VVGDIGKTHRWKCRFVKKWVGWSGKCNIPCCQIPIQFNVSAKKFLQKTSILPREIPPGDSGRFLRQIPHSCCST